MSKGVSLTTGLAVAGAAALIGAALPPDADAAAGNCAEFNAASGSYISVASSEQLKLTAPMTLEVWVKPIAGGGEWSLILGKQLNRYDSNPWYSYRFLAASASAGERGFPRRVNFNVAPANKGETGVGSTTVVPVDVWTHIAGVYDGQNLTVYINGTPEAVTPLTGGIQPSDLGLFIGKAPWTNCNNYHGQMDEIRLWSVARTQTEIQHAMNRSLAGSETGLVAYWPFNDAPGSPTAADATTNNHVGTFCNGAAIATNSTVPVDLPLSLVLGQARAFSIDAPGDADRFLFEAPAKFDAKLRVFSPLESTVRVIDDGTGQLIHDRNWSPGAVELPITAEQPTRFRIELRGRGDEAWSMDAGFLVLAPAGEGLAADRVLMVPVGGDGLEFSFSRVGVRGLPRPAKVTVDVDGDGTVDVDVPESGSRTFRLPAAGAYRARVEMTGAGHAPLAQELLVGGPRGATREGLLLSLEEPTPGQQLDRAIAFRAKASSGTPTPVAKVSFVLDGRITNDVFSSPYEWPVDWQQVTGKEHALHVVAVDGDGNRAEIKRAFTLSPFMGLQPADGATLSGEQVLVNWLGTDFGKAQARWREAGKPDGEWTTVEGEDSRFRTIAFKGLEPGRKYEFQAMSGNETNAVRSFNLVKGLAFGTSAYGANIRRDYDQRVGISVRNNGDKPLTVRLECGKPEDPLLLVGFVGEGSEDKPIPLGPGEEREFLLGISAQDVLTEQHGFPVRITSDQGLSDEAMVNVSVRLPVVKLQWEELGPAAYGLGRRYRLRNLGDGVTDLAITEASGDVDLSPSVNHGLLPAGQSIEILACARLSEVSAGLKTELSARAAGKEFRQPLEVRLEPGDKLHRVWLLPGVDPRDPARLPEYRRLSALARHTAETSAPGAVDWSVRENPEDANRDGRPDRWSRRIGDVLWVGEDSDGDDAVDFVHADAGADGIFEYSAFKTETGWEPTNLVEAWLEMGFGLRGRREDYMPHDVDVVLNGTVVGSLKDTIPEGHYRFRIPASLLHFNAAGRPEDNRVGIQSRHLRGGHYAVNSDFRISLRLAATPVWMAAPDEAGAFAQAMAMDAVSLNGADLSLSSSELRIVGAAELKKGDAVVVQAMLRNLGAVPPQAVEVALMVAPPGRPAVEAARITLENPSSRGATTVNIPWTVAAGGYDLLMVADPDGKLEDLNRENNTAQRFMRVAGEEEKPTLRIVAPTAGAALSDPLVTLRVEAKDDSGISRIEVSVDGGLWVDVSPDGGAVATCLLQPGLHRIAVQATDGNGNQTHQEVQSSVTAPLPETKVLFPPDGTNIAARATQVLVQCDASVALVAARVDGGAWHRAGRRGRVVRCVVPLRYGPQTIEVVAVNDRGVAAFTKTTVNCTRQPLPGQAPDPALAAPEEGTMTLGGTLEVDVFEGLNQVVPAAFKTPVAKSRQWPPRPQRPAPAAPPAPVDAQPAWQPVDTCVYRSLVGDGLLTLRAVREKLDFAARDAAGAKLFAFEGSLLLRTEDGPRLWGRGAAEGSADGQPIQYQWNPDGRLLQFIWPTSLATNLWPSLWIRVRSDNPELLWEPGVKP